MNTRLKSEDFLNGQLLLIDKPLNWTSFDVVNKIRYGIRKSFDIKKIKVGHAGTLDPLATGLLILCTGRATKQISDYMNLPKEYTGIIKLGATTPSYDLESQVDQTYVTAHITDEMIETVRQQFSGEIEQVPPIFSAIKKDGQKAYDLARKGQDPKMESRQVHIHELDLHRESELEVTFRVKCSKGTYIRSLAHDIGKALNSGGYLTNLRRTKIGDFKVEEAVAPLAFLEQLQP